MKNSLSNKGEIILVDKRYVECRNTWVEKAQTLSYINETKGRNKNEKWS